MGALKGFLNGPVERELAAAYEREIAPRFEARAGRAPESREDVSDLFREHPLYQLWGAAVYESQNLMWDTVDETCRRLLPELERRYDALDDATRRGSLELDLEAQLERAGDAEIWINGSTSWASLAAMTDEEPRYGEFAAHAAGEVWVYNRIQNENGGVDYFERGVTRPDLVLTDLLKIFHPELAEDREFEWYQQVAG